MRSATTSTPSSAAAPGPRSESRPRVLASALAAGLGVAQAAVPELPEHREFASTAVARLRVVETRGNLAVVEGEQDEVVLVHLSDRIGLEAARVDRISRGCLLLSGDGGQFSLCAEAAATPRS